MYTPVACDGDYPPMLLHKKARLLYVTHSTVPPPQQHTHPGLSLMYTGPPLTALAAACIQLASPMFVWNISQSYVCKYVRA